MTPISRLPSLPSQIQSDPGLADPQPAAAEESEFRPYVNRTGIIPNKKIVDEFEDALPPPLVNLG